MFSFKHRSPYPHKNEFPLFIDIRLDGSKMSPFLGCGNGMLRIENKILNKKTSLQVLALNSVCLIDVLSFRIPKLCSQLPIVLHCHNVVQQYAFVQPSYCLAPSVDSCKFSVFWVVTPWYCVDR